MYNPQEAFDIQDYMTKGVERVVADAIRATLKNPRESAFMVRFAAASRRASQKRRKADHAGGCVLYEKRDLVERIMTGQSN